MPRVQRSVTCASCRGLPGVQGARPLSAGQPGLYSDSFLRNNQHVSHGATWIPYPFIIYIFCNLGFQFVYRIVLGSSKRAKEEICIAELRAVQRPPVSAFSARDTRFPPTGPPPLHVPLSVQLEQNTLICRNLVMPLASGKCFFDGEISFSRLCFICGNAGVNDLNSHGKVDRQAERAPGLGAAALQGFPWRGRSEV